MSRITDADLQAFFHTEPMEVFRITGLRDSGDALYLGAVAIDHTRPMWGFGMWGGLSDTARFYTRDLKEAQTGAAGVAIIFRQFDHSAYSDEPSEMFAGWVGPDHVTAAEGWVAELNTRIAAHLKRHRVADDERAATDAKSPGQDSQKESATLKKCR